MKNLKVKDINGKYVHEGDIVLTKYIGTQKVVYMEEYASYWPISSILINNKLGSEPEHFEIIGNVKNNPELLIKGRK